MKRVTGAGTMAARRAVIPFVVEKVVALPSQTTLVKKDDWIDAEKAKAEKAALDEGREMGDAGPQVKPRIS